MEERNRSIWSDAEELSRLLRQLAETGESDMKRVGELLVGNEYSQEFISKITSEEYFKQADGHLRNAFEKRDYDGFMSRVKQTRRSRSRRTIGWSAAAVAVIAAVVFTAIEPAYKPSRIAGEWPATPSIIHNDTVINLSADLRELHTGDNLFAAVPDAAMADNDYRQLIVPAGHMFTIILDDSSRVTLNSGSRLGFPGKFATDLREVKLTGEAWFEVTKSDKPFIVNTEQGYVRVYGTQFSVNVRQDNMLYAVLAEGSIGVGGATGDEIMIAPGQMIAREISGGHTVSRVDPYDYTAWRHDLFRSRDGSFNGLIAEIEAWYGVRFDYKASKFESMTINISVGRDTQLEELLSFIEELTQSKNVKFKKGKNDDYGITMN